MSGELKMLADAGQFFMVRTKNGAKYRLRDGTGFGRPMKEVGGSFVPFLFRPNVDENQFVVEDVNLNFIEDADKLYRMTEILATLIKELGICEALFNKAKEIQAGEIAFDGGKYVRSITEIMKDPMNTSMRDTANKIAHKRAAQAAAMIESSGGTIDAGALGEETV